MLKLNGFAITDIIDAVFRNHPRECVFAPGARERIIANVTGCRSEDQIIDRLVEAFEAEEIYCPHDMIDRRAEFNWPHPTTAAWQEWAAYRAEMT